MTWSILLSPSVTVIAAAQIMATLGCEGEVIADDWIRLTPKDPAAPEPSGKQLTVAGAAP